MQNDKGTLVDLYVPRKWFVEMFYCHPFDSNLFNSNATNRLIHAKDHAAIQLTIPHVNNDGNFNGDKTTISICGYLRKIGKSDAAITRIAQNKGFTNAFKIYDRLEN